MKKLTKILVITALLLIVPATALAGTALERTLSAGWFCDDIAGAMHCFDPGEMHSKNPATINVKVYDYDGHFEGTEQIWVTGIWQKGEPPCPQDELLDLGFAMACHHYSH